MEARRVVARRRCPAHGGLGALRGRPLFCDPGVRWCWSEPPWSGARRTPESTLHVLALLEGCPGALVVQQCLRYQRRKADFRCIFLVTVLGPVAACVGAHTPEGRALLARWHL